MPRATSSQRLAALLRVRKEDLIRRWAERILGDPAVPEANRLTEPELRDHAPALIDRIVGCLDGSGGEAAGRLIPNAEGREHARQRLAKEYEVTEAMTELSHLRAAILDLAAEQGVRLDRNCALCLHLAIDQSMISGCREMERAKVEKSRERARVRERFIAILGHDLRSPVQSIRFAAALLMRDAETERQHHLAGQIAASADRMGRMIADVLDLTRARSDAGLPIEPKQADLHAIAQQVIDELRIAHPNRSVQLDAHGDMSGVWDPDRMAQVMSNLVSNALHYSPSDTPVRVTLRGEAHHVLALVNNRGPTIAPEVMAQIFEPFVRGFQGARVAHGEGLGLGLFITQQIIAAHGGSIDVASTTDEGTTFTVRVPR
jgi:signal transduction histidine kinase